MANPTIYFIIGMIALFGLILYLVILSDKKRTKALSNFAMQRGFTFNNFQKNYTVPQLSLFHKGHSRSSKNVLRGMYHNMKWVVFDYRYTTGHGKNSSTHNQTVAHAQLEHKVPAFNLSQEHLGHKIIGLVGYNDIDFDNHPKFSKNYYLKSKDQNIRKLFNSDVFHFFETRVIKYIIEASGNDIILYRNNKRIKPRNLHTFLDESAEIVKLFQGSAKRFTNP